MSGRCDICGKFRRAEQLVEREERSISDEYGSLKESWWLECDECSPRPVDTDDLHHPEGMTAGWDHP